MLSAAIILPEDSSLKNFKPLLSIKEVEWEGLFYSGEAQPSNHNHSLIFSSPEIIPLICDLLIVMDPAFCNIDYLSMAIRNGCHLFLSDALHLNSNDRRELIQLANEGGTSIQIQNDFLLNPFLKKITNYSDQKCFIEVVQSHGKIHHRLYDLLLNNLLLTIRAAGSSVIKFDVFCGTITSDQPFIVNIHLNFENGTVATLTLKLNQSTNAHHLSIYSEQGNATFDLSHNQIGTTLHNQINNTPLVQQLTNFIHDITENKNPGFSLNEEIKVFLLMEKIKDRLGIQSFSVY